MMLVDMADDAAHIVQLRWYVVELAFAVDVQHPALVIQTYAYPTIFHQKPGLLLLSKSCDRLKTVILSFVRFTVPRTELSAVAAFVTVSVEVQRLETVLEALGPQWRRWRGSGRHPHTCCKRSYIRGSERLPCATNASRSSLFTSVIEISPLR